MFRLNVTARRMTAMQQIIQQLLRGTVATQTHIIQYKTTGAQKCYSRSVRPFTFCN